VKVERKDGVAIPSQFTDYTITIDRDGFPEGVEIIEVL